MSVDFNMTTFGVDALAEELEALQTSLEDAPDWFVGTNIVYAPFVEFGTGKHAQLGEGSEPWIAPIETKAGTIFRWMEGTKPQPYFRPAVRRVAADFDRYVAQANGLDELIQTLALAIEREAKRIVPVDLGNLQGSIEAEPMSPEMVAALQMLQEAAG